MKGRNMWILKLMLYLAVAYTILLVFTFFFQRRMLYFPDRRVPSKMQLRALGLQFWPSEGQTYRGFIRTEQTARDVGTVIVFHGNAGAAWDRDHYIEKLEPSGVRVVLAEYPGYGGRSGRMSEKELLADAKSTVRLAYEKYGKPLFLCGESLGCGVATGVAADSPVPIEGLVLLTPWDSLPNLAQTIYWYLPARWLVRDRYDNIRNMEGFPGRVAVALAEHDEIIPKRRGLRLYEALSCEKKLWILTGAGHNTWPRTTDVSWWREVLDFVAATGGMGSY
jgi:alpha-beta hydrolase superfamily lysophospholipase